MSIRSRLQSPLTATSAGNPNLVPLPPQGNLYAPGRFHNANLPTVAESRTQLPVVTAQTTETVSVPVSAPIAPADGGPAVVPVVTTTVPK